MVHVFTSRQQKSRFAGNSQRGIHESHAELILVLYTWLLVTKLNRCIQKF